MSEPGSRPSPHVLAAFGVAGEPQSLDGGTGRAWRVGHLVFKPLDCAPAEIPWQAELFSTIEQRGFRVAAPLPEIVDGWIASRWLEGAHVPRRWLDIIEAGRAFHEALAHVPRPGAILDGRMNPWEIGDRVAWGRQRYEGIDALLDALEPVDDASQLIHGDLTGNVLFDDALPPAIIDFAPYWHPPEYASAIVVADALCWEDAPPDLADVVDRQYLLRALIYRAVTSREFGGDGSRELEVARHLVSG
jgi:hypothetical protein